MRFKNPFSSDLRDPSTRGEYELVNNEAGSSSHQASGQESTPTDVELRTLRKVSDNLPWSTFVIATVELCERFTFHGLSGPLQNYIANPPPTDATSLPGALGLHQQSATAMADFFLVWCYLTPILGAVVADQYSGKYLAIFYFGLVYLVGLCVLFLTSLPASIAAGWALPGLVVAMVVIGLGTGGIKANVGPLIAEQYRNTKTFVRREPQTGERVLVDPDITVQRIYMIFYMCINVGGMSNLVTTTLEARIGFWAAFGLCSIVFVLGFGTLVANRGRYVLNPPNGSILPHAVGVLWRGFKGGGLEAAKPDAMGHKAGVPWDAAFVDDVRQAMNACKVAPFMPIYWCAMSQMHTNIVSQAGQMELHGIPNDIMVNINPTTLIIFIPLFDTFIYPFLRRASLPFRPIARMTAGYFVASLAMLYAAYVQAAIYASPPCYSHPCADRPNKVHIALQAPVYFLLAISEIFLSVTGLEYAFTMAPKSMKSLVMAGFLLTTAGGAVLGALVSPFAKDPEVAGLFLGLGVICAVTGVVFWVVFRGSDEAQEQDKQKQLDLHDEDEHGAVGPLGVEVASALARESLEDRIQRRRDGVLS